MSKSPSLRRIQADIRELALDPSDRYHAAPLETDMFEWHFTIRGAEDTDFAGGVYHGRILLPAEYPFKPPHILFLTPSGRFETNTKVCLSFSAYHPELWQPAWGIRLILEALISFLPTPADGAIGALDWTPAERKRLAKKSVDYYCPTCGCKAITLLPKLKPKSEIKDGDSSKPKSRFQKEIEQLQLLQSTQHKKEDKEEDTKEEPKSDEKEPSLKEEEPVKVEAPAVKADAPTAQKPTEEPPQIAPVPALAPPSEENQQQPLPPAMQHPENHTAPVEPQVLPPPQEVPAAAPQQLVPQEEGIPSWMVDPVLHGIIVVLAVLCFVLLRKLQAVMEELYEVNQVLGDYLQ